MTDYNNDLNYKDFTGSGCLSIYTLPPLAALSIATFLIILWSTFSISNNIHFTGQDTNPATQKTQISSLFTPEVQHWNSKIKKWSKTWGMDPNLIATIIQIESCGDPNAQSSAGALGLFQVMPYHFQSDDDPFDPETNAKRGLAYLSASLQDKQGDIRLGLAGYNGGISGSRKPENLWPSETLRYIYWGMGIYQDAMDGLTKSERLDEWLNHGGSSLCKTASQRLGLEIQN